MLAAGGALSHHHGVGLNRSRFVGEALGDGFGVLQSVKDALDPNGILNPGKLGLAHPFGGSLAMSDASACSSSTSARAACGRRVFDAGRHAADRH